MVYWQRYLLVHGWFHMKLLPSQRKFCVHHASMHQYHEWLTGWSTIPACLSLICSFNRGNIEGTNSSKICVMFVYVCFMFVWQLVLWIDLTDGLYIYKRRVLKCAFAYDLSLSLGDPVTTTTTLPVFQPFLEIREGRHPCIGGSFVGSDFIPNDTVTGIPDVSTWQKVQLSTTALFYLLYLITEILEVKSPSVSRIFIDWLINDHLYSAILHSLEQTHSACMWFYMSD